MTPEGMSTAETARAMVEARLGAVGLRDTPFLLPAGGLI
jgi:hypothetical protein